MSGPTREGFLNFVRTPLHNLDRDPLAGSPTKSTMRYRWRELREWDVEAEAVEHWDVVTNDDKASEVAGAPWVLGVCAWTAGRIQ